MPFSDFVFATKDPGILQDKAVASPLALQQLVLPNEMRKGIPPQQMPWVEVNMAWLETL